MLRVVGYVGPTSRGAWEKENVMSDSIKPINKSRYGFRESTREVFDSNHNNNWKSIGKLANGKSVDDFRRAMHAYRQEHGSVAPGISRPTKAEFLRAADVIA